MLKRNTTTVPALSRTHSGFLNDAFTVLLIFTNTNLFQTNTNLIATAEPSQMLYQQHTTTTTTLPLFPQHTGSFFVIPSSLYIPTVSPMNPVLYLRKTIL